jgi:pathogenesis-related protein 1
MGKRLTFRPQPLRAFGAAGLLAAVLAACSSSNSGSDSAFEPTGDDGGGTGSGGAGSGSSSGGASGNPAADTGATGTDDATTPSHGGSSGGTGAGHGDDDATTGSSHDASGSSSSGGSSGSSGSSGAGADEAGGNPETGRLVGITADHNAVRAMVSTSTALPPLVWSTTVAAYAQDWANTQASTNCASPSHRPSSDLEAQGYGENLAVFDGAGQGVSLSTGVSTAADAVNAWASEKACWTYGEFMTTDACNATCVANLDSDGCGHYTQIVWRSTMELGCGVASCMNGQSVEDIWICNYAPAGNLVGAYPY